MPTRIGRRFIHSITFIGHSNGIPNTGAMVLQVGFGEQPTSRLAKCNEIPGYFTRAIGVAPLCGDLPQGLTQVFLIDNVPGMKRLTIICEDRPRIWIGCKAFCFPPQTVRQFVTERKALFAKGDCWRKNIFERARAKVLVSNEPAIYQAGYRNTQNTLHRDTTAFEIKLPGRARWGCASGIDGGHRARFGRIDQDKSIAARA